MRRTALTMIALVVILTGAAWHGWSQTLKLAEGHFITAEGRPLANQTLLFEGYAKPSWKFGWFPFWSSKPDPFNRLAITDASGYVQLIDMPPGQYTIKLVRPGSAPAPLNKFTLSTGYSTHDFSAKYEGFENPMIDVNPKQ